MQLVMEKKKNIEIRLSFIDIKKAHKFVLWKARKEIELEKKLIAHNSINIIQFGDTQKKAVNFKQQKISYKDASLQDILATISKILEQEM